MTALATSLESRNGRSWRAAGRRALRVLFEVLLPALLAGLVFRYLVPAAGSGWRGVVALVGHRHPMPFGVALFLLFSGLARYWSYRYAGPPARLATQALPSRRRAEILGVVLAVTVAAGAALVVRAYVRPYRVLSPSMLPTLEQDDLIAGRMRPHTSVNSSTPSRGDVVVFHGSAVSSKLGGARVPEILVKRVVGLPGDLIEMRGDVPVINGWTVPTCDAGEYLYVIPDVTGQALRGRLRIEFLDDRAYLTVHAVGRPFVGAYRVKPGEVFVLGDNRGNSMDSRAYSYGHGGGVPLDAIEARVQWFLVGTQRTGDADFGRLLRPIDGLRAPLPLDGVQGLQRPPSEEGIARCLRNRPADTRAPLPDHVP